MQPWCSCWCQCTQHKRQGIVDVTGTFCFCTGICPRNHSKFFEHIVDTKQEIQADIEEFFEDVIDGDFIEEGGCCEFSLYLFLLLCFKIIRPVA